MSDFHEVLFPVDISYGSEGGPKWKTSVFQADSGFEARVSDWKSTRAEYDVSQGIKVQGQMDALTRSSTPGVDVPMGSGSRTGTTTRPTT
jgi:uncharacterized protein (TIGR02217 family)